MFPTAPSADQLVHGARPVQPIGPCDVEDVRLFQKDAAGLRMSRSITGTRFVRAYGERGYALAHAAPEP